MAISCERYIRHPSHRCPFSWTIVHPGRNHSQRTQKRAQRRITDLALEHTVTFTGALTQDELHRQYASASVLLFPTRYSEGFPMVILEAMAHGLAILATDTGAIAETLGTSGDHPAGIVVTHTNDHPPSMNSRISYTT